jgi:hypothetical protein
MLKAKRDDDFVLDEVAMVSEMAPARRTRQALAAATPSNNNNNNNNNSRQQQQQHQFACNAREQSDHGSSRRVKKEGVVTAASSPAEQQARHCPYKECGNRLIAGPIVNFRQHLEMHQRRASSTLMGNGNGAAAAHGEVARGERTSCAPRRGGCVGGRRGGASAAAVTASLPSGPQFDPYDVPKSFGTPFPDGISELQPVRPVSLYVLEMENQVQNPLMMNQHGVGREERARARALLLVDSLGRWNSSRIPARSIGTAGNHAAHRMRARRAVEALETGAYVRFNTHDQFGRRRPTWPGFGGPLRRRAARATARTTTIRRRATCACTRTARPTATRCAAMPSTAPRRPATSSTRFRRSTSCRAR